MNNSFPNNNGIPGYPNNIVPNDPSMQQGYQPVQPVPQGQSGQPYSSVPGNMVSPLSPQYHQPQANTGGSVVGAEVSPIVNPEAMSKQEIREMQQMNVEQSKNEQHTTVENHLLKPINNQVAQNPPAQIEPADPLEILGIKLYGYKFSTQLANMKNRFIGMSGKGNPSKAKSWLIMLLDRLLRMEDNKGN